MGKLKFEKTFSEKLKCREIEPKGESWEKLSKRLDASRETKRGTTYWWIGIAATIIGAILIFGSYFNEPVSESPGIVNVPKKQPAEEETDVQKNSSEEVKLEEIVYKEKEAQNNTIEKELKISEEQKPGSIKSKSAVAAIDKSTEAQEPVSKAPEVKGAVSETSRAIEDAIADVVQQEYSGNITEAEVDALLAKAAAEISETKREEFSSEKIDASSLLREVEFEMEESFRDKVFEVLKEGYLKARTAVANRNY